MDIKIDWISFSFFQDENHYDTDKEAIERAYQTLLDGVGENGSPFFTQQRWEKAPGRKPYSTSRRTPDGGLALFANAKLPHALIEMSGKGCDRLLLSAYAEHILPLIVNRVTRLDLACDIETDIDPREFAEQREAGRFKSGSVIVSDSGTTVYVGSKTSDRYARVYRYAKPHPRSHLLRVEHVFKGPEAKATLSYLLADGYGPAAAECGRMFGWKHPLWQVDTEATGDLKTERPERAAAKTVFWLYDTVAPVLARLHNEGVLSLHDFLSEAVLPLIKTDDTE